MLTMICFFPPSKYILAMYRPGTVSSVIYKLTHLIFTSKVYMKYILFLILILQMGKLK